MGVDLTSYLVARTQTPSKVIKIEGAGSSGGGSPTQVKINS
jgi:hypothetical protein